MSTSENQILPTSLPDSGDVLLTPLPPKPVEPPPRPLGGSRRLGYLLFVFGVLAAMLIFPYVVEQVQYAITRGDQRAKAEIARAELDRLGEPESRYVKVADAIRPSVVGIETVGMSRRRVRSDDWSHLFPMPEPRDGGVGSGVIVDGDGYIVTNFHVIDQASEITVVLSSGERVSGARVVGVDPLNDLAVLKIRHSGLTAAAWGDSDRLQVGDHVMAVGNPYGLSWTMTAGIVSAKERRAAVENRGFQEFLQTDAAINPGNSGGPLVNLKGEIVGINTAIFGEAYRGISFSIPSRVARDVYEQLKTTGRTVRGWLGVAMDVVTERTARDRKLPEARGALVEQVVPGSPAERSGIEPGDVIVELDGRQIDDPAELSVLVARTRIGTAVKVIVIRDGKRKELSVKIAERPLQLGG